MTMLDEPTHHRTVQVTLTIRTDRDDGALSEYADLEYWRWMLRDN